MDREIPIIAKSPRFTLIPFNPDDHNHCQFLVTLWNTPLFIGSCGKTSIDTPEKAKALINRRFISEYQRNGYGTYLILLHPTPNEGDLSESSLVGTVSLTKGDSEHSYSAPDLGFEVLPETTDASKIVMQFAKDELGVEDVFGFCDPERVASRRVLEKAGLEFRGIHKLAAFGGVMGTVYALPHMDKDLSIYGLRG
jgi:RimJ/RimL family protein N-acetyltransferase